MSAETVTVEDSQRPFFAGIDVGGTSVKLGIVDDLGRTLAFTSFPTENEKGPEFSVNRMSRTISELLASAEINSDELVAIGLVIPGTLDIPTGMVLAPPNLPGWRDFPIRDALADITQKPVAFGNDAGGAAFGEFWVGSGRDYDSIVMFTLGTGVGGGIIVDGKSIDGEHSHGSECGHVIVDTSPTARLCSCGKSGHLEAYASATGVVNRTREALRAGKKSSISNRMAAGESLSGLMIFLEAEAGDALANEIIMETADYLSIGCANMIHAIDPTAIILGGAMNFGGHNKATGKAFLERIDKQTRSKVFPTPARQVRIDFAQLGGDAGYIGSAGFARILYQGKASTHFTQANS